MDDKDETWEHAGLQCMLKIRRTPGQGPFNGYDTITVLSRAVEVVRG